MISRGVFCELVKGTTVILRTIAFFTRSKNKSFASFQRGDSIEDEDSSRDDENGIGEIGTHFETVELNEVSDEVANVDVVENVNHEQSKRFFKSPFKGRNKKKPKRKGKIVSLSSTDRSYA